MPGFSKIIGHEQVIGQLKKAIINNRVGHAYLIEGGPGSGKMMLAKAFALALLCEDRTPDGDSCGQCRACRQAESGNHPDLILVHHEKSALISVGEIRDQLVSDIGIKPYNGGYKVYIVKDADLMNASAQNALLKTLEEPPVYAVILLLTRNAAALLETVRSRCLRLNLEGLDNASIQAWLMDEMKLPDYQARMVSAFAAGSIGRAAQLAGSEDFMELRESALRTAVTAHEMDSHQILLSVSAAEQYKDRIRNYLETLTLWFRDVLTFKATQSPDQLVFLDRVTKVREAASRTSYEGLEAILQAIDKAYVRLGANVSFGLTMELLFLTIKENT